jgi:hypothetical protein
MTFTLSNENTPLARGVDGTKNTTERDDTTTHADGGKFAGTSNPRHLRAIAGLLRRAMPRETLDREAGCSNAPELVAELRRRGLDVPCDRVPVFDRDGLEVQRGVYHLSSADKRKIHRWFAVRRRSSCS